MSTERKMIRRKVGEIYPSDLDGTLSEAIAYLVKTKEEIGVDAELDYDHHDPYGDSKSYGIFVREPESDEVFAERKRQEAEARQTQVAYLKKQAAAFGFELTEKKS